MPGSGRQTTSNQELERVVFNLQESGVCDTSDQELLGRTSRYMIPETRNLEDVQVGTLYIQPEIGRMYE